MTYAHRRFPKKRAVNVSLSEDLIDGAKKHGINLSELIERRIEREIRTLNMRAWCEEHREAIEERNRFTEKNGLLSEKFGVIRNRFEEE